jgi:hypothetical protein
MGHLARLSIHFFSVSYLQYQYCELFILYVADEPVIAHSISPEFTLVAAQRLAQLTEIFEKA